MKSLLPLSMLCMLLQLVAVVHSQVIAFPGTIVYPADTLKDYTSADFDDKINKEGTITKSTTTTRSTTTIEPTVIYGNLKINGSISGNLDSEALRVSTTWGNLDIGARNNAFTHIYSNLPRFIVNQPFYTLTGEISSYHAASSLSLQTGGTPRMTILNSNGNVGIGTTTPFYKLDVAGNLRLEETLTIVGSTDLNIGGSLSLLNTSKTGIGQARQWVMMNTGGSLGNALQFWAYDNVGCPDGLCNNRFTILDDGRVGIGISNHFPSDYKLVVAGRVLAEEVVVKLRSNWPDYVFNPGYELLPLPQLESYITEHRRLPGIPSAHQVEDQGMSVGEIQRQLMEKVEELTLYIIEQDKRIRELEQRHK